MEKNVEMSCMLDFYGGFLTDRQRSFVELHYNQDLSLAEVGQEWGVSRQAVHDGLKRAEGVLRDMEQKLGLMARYMDVTGRINAVKEAVEALEVNPGQHEKKAAIIREINEITAIWEDGHGL